MLRYFREGIKRIPVIGSFLYYFYLRLFYDRSITARASYEWITFLGSNELLKQMVLKRPMFSAKPLSDYLNMKYQFAERVHSLVSHYNFVLSRIPKTPLVHILFGDGLILAQFHGKTGAMYRVVLGIHPNNYTEGDLLLKIEDAEGRIVNFVLFNIGSLNGKPRIEVGCLQGAAPPRESTLTKTATKDFYSTRPKHLIMAILYELSRYWEINSIVCVKTNEQVNYNRGSNQEFYADYDRFWEELGGFPDISGFYVMPPQLSHRDKSNGPRDHSKIRRHRQRIELRSTVSAMIKSKLDYVRIFELEVSRIDDENATPTQNPIP
jgi:uncharacterized protein